MPVNGFSYAIAWSDFTTLTARPYGVTEDAQIHPEIGPGKIKLGRKGRSVSISAVDIDITLVAQDCWVLSSQNNNSDLLSHEQGHYDIIAICAREMYNSFIKLFAASVHELQTQATKVQETFQRKVAKVDELYDTQTDHSRNKTNQQTWNHKIAAEKQKPDGSIDNLP